MKQKYKHLIFPILVIGLIILALIVVSVRLQGKEKGKESLVEERESKPPEPHELPPPEAVEESRAKLKVFDVKISKAGFEPATFSVLVGEVLQLNLTALDGTYDFFIPSIAHVPSVKPGEVQSISIDAVEKGTLIFSCHDKCSAGKTIKGEIIVQ